MHLQSTNNVLKIFDSFKFAHDNYDALPQDSGPFLISDLAKTIDAPIFHVNGDNVEAVNFVCQLAADYSAKYKKDVVIDVVCYRRYGHNETHQPSFTQPRMYKAIEKQPTPLTQYIKFLVGRGTFTEKDIEICGSLAERSRIHQDAYRR